MVVLRIRVLVIRAEVIKPWFRKFPDHGLLEPTKHSNDMKEQPNNLLVAIRKLASALEASQKKDAFAFYENLSRRITDASTPADLKNILEEIRKSAVIAQYVGFSSTEDVLFNRMHEEAMHLLNDLH